MNEGYTAQSIASIVNFLGDDITQEQFDKLNELVKDLPEGTSDDRDSKKLVEILLGLTKKYKFFE